MDTGAQAPSKKRGPSLGDEPPAKKKLEGEVLSNMGESSVVDKPSADVLEGEVLSNMGESSLVDKPSADVLEGEGSMIGSRSGKTISVSSSDDVSVDTASDEADIEKWITDNASHDIAVVPSFDNDGMLKVIALSSRKNGTALVIREESGLINEKLSEFLRTASEKLVGYNVEQVLDVAVRDIAKDYSEIGAETFQDFAKSKIQVEWPDGDPLSDEYLGFTAYIIALLSQMSPVKDPPSDAGEDGEEIKSVDILVSHYFLLPFTDVVHVSSVSEARDLGASFLSLGVREIDSVAILPSYDDARLVAVSFSNRNSRRVVIIRESAGLLETDLPAYIVGISDKLVGYNVKEVLGFPVYDVRKPYGDSEEDETLEAFANRKLQVNWPQAHPLSNQYLGCSTYAIALLSESIPIELPEGFELPDDWYDGEESEGIDAASIKSVKHEEVGDSEGKGSEENVASSVEHKDCTGVEEDNKVDDRCKCVARDIQAGGVHFFFSFVVFCHHIVSRRNISFVNIEGIWIDEQSSFVSFAKR